MISSIAIAAVSLAPPSARIGHTQRHAASGFREDPGTRAPRNARRGRPVRGGRFVIKHYSRVSCRHEYWDHLTDQGPALAKGGLGRARQEARDSSPALTSRLFRPRLSPSVEWR